MLMWWAGHVGIENIGRWKDTQVRGIAWGEIHWDLKEVSRMCEETLGGWADAQAEEVYVQGN